MDEQGGHRQHQPLRREPVRARYSESCTSGSEGGSEKPTERKLGRALQPDPYTYVATWSGFAYTAFVIDAFSKRIIGWRVATSLHTHLALNALERAIWTCSNDDLGGLTHHSDLT
jgi:transposase InsO family protein